MTKKFTTGIAVAVSIVVVGLFFVFNNPLSVFNSIGTTPAANEQLLVQDETTGTGATAAVGDTVVVHYTGRLEDGTVFDSSEGKDPITFVLGRGQVIQGWDQGIIGMAEGGKRVLIIPPSLGYGDTAYGPIPGNSTLIFEVQLVRVEKGQ